MGEETRQITNKLEDVIRSMAVDVGKISTTQAVIQTKQDSTYTTVGRIEEKVNKINSRVDSLESTRDKAKGMGKVLGWVFGFVIGIPGLAWGVIKVVEWLNT